MEQIQGLQEFDERLSRAHLEGYNSGYDKGQAAGFKKGRDQSSTELAEYWQKVYATHYAELSKRAEELEKRADDAEAANKELAAVALSRGAKLTISVTLNVIFLLVFLLFVAIRVFIPR